MRERLESTDANLGRLEGEAGDIERRMDTIESALKAMETALAEVAQRGDQQVASALERNLAQKQARLREAQEIVARIAAELTQVGNEMEALSSQNENARQEVDQLHSEGIDTTEAQAKIEMREQTLAGLQQRYRDLLSRLGRLGSVVGTGGGYAHEFVQHGELVRLADLKPNSVYEKNGYRFVTSDWGGIVSAEGYLELRRGVRNQPIQDAVRELGRTGDEGGHLIGTQFNGPPDAYNLRPQLHDMNRHAYLNMERGWAEAVDAGHRVYVKIEPQYGRDKLRPAAFRVAYWINGVKNKRLFWN